MSATTVGDLPPGPTRSAVDAQAPGSGSGSGSGSVGVGGSGSGSGSGSARTARRPDRDESSRLPAAAERGSVTLLILGFALVLILAIVGITAVSEVYLTRRSLASVADDAALAGAQAVDQIGVVTGEPGSARLLDPAGVDAAVAANLDQAGAGGLRGFGYGVQVAGGGTVVIVEVHARSRVGIAGFLLGGATVEVRELGSAVAADHG